MAVRGETPLFAIYTHQIWGANDHPVLYIVRDFEILPHAKLSSEIKTRALVSPGQAPPGYDPQKHGCVSRSILAGYPFLSTGDFTQLAINAILPGILLSKYMLEEKTFMSFWLKPATHQDNKFSLNCLARQVNYAISPFMPSKT